MARIRTPLLIVVKPHTAVNMRAFMQIWQVHILVCSSILTDILIIIVVCVAPNGLGRVALDQAGHTMIYGVVLD